jgi:hypothetical protein
MYPQRFPNASAVTGSLVLQMRKLANKTEQFWKCDDFSGEIASSPIKVQFQRLHFYTTNSKILMWDLNYVDNFRIVTLHLARLDNFFKNCLDTPKLGFEMLVTQIACVF